MITPHYTMDQLCNHIFSFQNPIHHSLIVFNADAGYLAHAKSGCTLAYFSWINNIFTYMEIPPNRMFYLYHSSMCCGTFGLKMYHRLYQLTSCFCHDNTNDTWWKWHNECYVDSNDPYHINYNYYYDSINIDLMN